MWTLGQLSKQKARSAATRFPLVCGLAGISALSGLSQKASFFRATIDEAIYR